MTKNDKKIKIFVDILVIVDIIKLYMYKNKTVERDGGN